MSFVILFVFALLFRVNLTTIRRALYNTFQIRFRLGLFDPVSDQPYLKLRPATDVNTPYAQQLNREASRQSLILLQNRESVLPFAVPKEGRVVVVGASADSSRLYGGGHYARAAKPTDNFLSMPDAVAQLLSAESGTGSGTSIGSSAKVEIFPGMKCVKTNNGVCTQPKRDASLLDAATKAAGGADGASTAHVILVLNLQSLAPCDSDAAVADGEEFNPCGYEAEQHGINHTVHVL